jgi:hypothetical protein
MCMQSKRSADKRTFLSDEEESWEPAVKTCEEGVKTPRKFRASQPPTKIVLVRASIIVDSPLSFRLSVLRALKYLNLIKGNYDIYCEKMPITKLIGDFT